MKNMICLMFSIQVSEMILWSQVDSRPGWPSFQLEASKNNSGQRATAALDEAIIWNN